MPITYEFVVEQLDFYDGCQDEPDIIDTSGFDTMEEARAYAIQCDKYPWRICLRRDAGNALEGLTERYYAYPVNGLLQEQFETCTGAQDGPTVPLRFFKLKWDSRP